MAPPRAVPEAAAPSPPAQAARTSWRKRHPMLSRALLYGLGVALAGGGVWLWLERREQDRCDRECYLRSRLDTLPVVIQADPEGLEAQRVLDAEFSDPELPDDLEARAERLRGIVARLRRDPVAMDRAFARARNLDLSKDAVDALTLEWAQCRIVLRDLVGARQLLNAPTPQNPVLALWRLVIQAQLRDAAGEGDEARIALVTALDQLPKPVPRTLPAWFMLSEWHFEEVLIEAIQWLVAGLPRGSAQALPLWRRLPEFAPQDVKALVAAAEGLLASGDVVGARALWARARKVDPVFVAKWLAAKPALGTLETP